MIYDDGQCNIAILDAGISYIQVSAKARQCFSEAMAMLPLVDGVLQDSIFRVSATTADIFVIHASQCNCARFAIRFYFSP